MALPLPSPEFATVAVTLPIHETFSYRVPEPFRDQLSRGVRVLVPFGKRTITGFVVEYPASVPEGVAPREISKIKDHEPLLAPDLLSLTKWISEYYLAPLGEAMNLAVPKGIDSKDVEVVLLTEKGKEAIPYIADPTARRLLSQLDLKKPVKASTLERKFKGEKVGTFLKKFAREGLISLLRVMQEESVKERIEKFYFLQTGSTHGLEDIARRAPKQAGIIRFLSGGERSSGEIRAAFKNHTPTLNQLIAKNIVGVTEKTNYRNPMDGNFHLEAEAEGHKALTPEQITAFEKIRERVKARKFSAALLHGVTGSGKTEVYLQSISEAVRGGRQAILLVPEISLTPQMISRIHARFGKRVALLHSGLSQGERFDEWRRIRNGEADIAVGARSAIFAPFPKLGIIIVDEEHETSFKQEESPKYHAREVALMRGKFTGAVVILGSATPSLESVHNVRIGKYEYLPLPNRISSHPMPLIEMVDMRTSERGFKGAALSEALRRTIKETLDRKEQIFLFLNRRGTSHFLQCEECGECLVCPHCSVTLTFHGKVREMRCHYCNYFAQAPDLCPACGGHRIVFRGYGTQKLEEEVGDFFPGARTARMDRDAVRTKGSFFKIFKKLRQGEIDILIGTQMIAKGHDFPNVTLVGIVNADASLNIPDFRSGERTYQLIAQVAGRAGRAEKPGRVIVQSYNPGHYVYNFLCRNDFDGFCRKEEETRKMLLYPPFSRLAVFSFEGVLDEKAEQAATETAGILRGENLEADRLEIMGPTKALVHKVKDVYRWRLLVKGADYNSFRRFLAKHSHGINQRKKNWSGVRVTIDVDPAQIV
jgi:primosomal protein N' (replication factor Y)